MYSFLVRNVGSNPGSATSQKYKLRQVILGSSLGYLICKVEMSIALLGVFMENERCT